MRRPEVAGRITFSGHPIEIKALEADFVLDEKRIEIERFLLATPLSTLRSRDGSGISIGSIVRPESHVRLGHGRNLAPPPFAPAGAGALAIEEPLVARRGRAGRGTVRTTP